MRKAQKNRHLSGQQTLLAVSLTATLIAVGCTTDRNLGDGNPVVTPGIRTAPTAGPTSGSESAPAVPSMYSSSSNALPAATPRVHQRSAAEAAAIMADQLPAVRVLGPASPGEPGMQGHYSMQQATGQFINPALVTNPQVTVNSSISSAPTPVITSGAGGGGAIVGAVTAGGAIVDASTVSAGTGLTVGGNVNAAPVIATSTNALPLNVATTRALSPTASSVVTPSAGVSASSTLTTVTNARTAGVATTIGAGAVTNATPLATTTARSLSPTASSVLTPSAGISSVTGSSIAPATAGRATTARAARAASATVARPSVSGTSSVRMVTGADGQVVITNTRSRQ